MIENLTTATPVEIDTELANLYATQQRLSQIANWKADQRLRAVKRYLKMGYHQVPTDEQVREVIGWCLTGKTIQPSYVVQSVIEADEELQEATEALQPPLEAIRMLGAEFRRRGGWTRAFLVNNSNGHVHSSMDCSTCRWNTPFVWLPQYSGGTEETVVEDAGERACTVCYPSAPVEVLSRPTKIFSEDEKAAQQARKEREEKRAAKDAAKIVVEGMIGWTNEGRGRHVYPTPRGATNAIAGLLGSLVWYGTGHPSSDEWLNNVAVIREALSAKGVEYDYDKALAAARKKVTREGGQVQY